MTDQLKQTTFDEQWSKDERDKGMLLAAEAKHDLLEYARDR